MTELERKIGLDLGTLVTMALADGVLVWAVLTIMA